MHSAPSCHCRTRSFRTQWDSWIAVSTMFLTEIDRRRTSVTCAACYATGFRREPSALIPQPRLHSRLHARPGLVIPAASTESSRKVFQGRVVNFATLRSITSYGSRYDSSDDNRDDNCSPNDGRYGPILDVPCVVTRGLGTPQHLAHALASCTSLGVYVIT
jgi:hypothetical protein